MDKLNEARQRAKDIRLEMQKLHTKATAQRNIALKHNKKACKFEKQKRVLFSEYEKAQTEIMVLEQKQ